MKDKKKQKKPQQILNILFSLPTKQCALIIYLHVEIYGVDVAWYNSITH
jgi:hypothetical protein